jgi:hypothetical protein
MTSSLGVLRAWGYAPTVRGGVWVQGEEDSFYEPMAQSYGDNMRELLAAFRANWGPQLPVAVARINAPGRRYRDQVRSAQWAIDDPLVSVFDTDDLVLQDNVHYGQAGQVALGYRLAGGLLHHRYAAARWPGRSAPAGAAVPEPSTRSTAIVLACLFAGALLLARLCPEPPAHDGGSSDEDPMCPL